METPSDYLAKSTRITIPARAQVTIVINPGGCHIFFCRMPSREILWDLIKLQEDHPGIFIFQIVPVGLFTSCPASTPQLLTRDLLETPSVVYALYALPTYDPGVIAKMIVEYLYQHHGYTSINLADHSSSLFYTPQIITK
jgi:hypothetical protein